MREGKEGGWLRRMAKIPNVPMTMTIMRKSVSAIPAPNLPPRAEPAKYGVGVSPKGMKPASFE